MSQQAPPPTKQPDEMFCPSCGIAIKREAELCVHCGVRVGRPATGNKNKTAAILFAVFFGFFTWLYTYREDYGKFWIGLSVLIIGFILSIVAAGAVGVIVWFFAAMGTWIWAIADTASKNDEWYAKY